MVARNGKHRRPRIGFWLETASQAACEIARIVGYDIAVFDLEHGVLPLGDWERLTLTCKVIGLDVYARVASASRIDIQYALDFGADAVILPQIRDLPHAREVSVYAKYPPLGTRGHGWSRAMKYGAVPDAFFETENGRTKLYAMIETPGALADATGIARLPTVDGLFVGPGDLSLTRGRGPYKATEADLDEISAVAEAASAAGKLWGMPAPARQVFDHAMTHGAAFVTTCDDLTALRAGLEQGLEVAREGLGS